MTNKQPGSRSPPTSDETPEQNVRKSIGEWEAVCTDTTPSLTPTLTSTTEQAGPAKPKVPLSQEQKTSTTRKILSPSGKRTYATKTAEARACHDKAKASINSGKNIRADIKADVVEALDKLYYLVKEIEIELRKEKQVTSKGAPKEKSGANTTFVLDVNPDPIALKIDRQSAMIQENLRKLEELQASMETQRQVLEKVATTATYASVAAASSSCCASPNTTTSAKPATTRSTLHSVVVTSKQDTDSGEEVLDKLRKAVDAKEGWVKVERVRKAKDRKVIMGFRTAGDRDKFKECMGSKKVDLTIEEVQNKDPLLILKNVLTINTDADVLKGLRNQNRNVFQDLSAGDDRVEIKYRRRTRNPHICHIVISVSPIIWQRATTSGSVHIDLQRIRVEDQTPLLQCTRCLGYGHGKRFCTETVDLCSHCGGPHMRAECEDWIAAAPPKCRNCSKANLGENDHNSFSHACPVRKKWDDLARSTIAYC